jgi:hypothetical protein
VASKIAGSSVYDFYLWENIKGKVYRNTHHTAEALQNEIRNVIALILIDRLHCVSQGFLRMLKEYLRAAGNHSMFCRDSFKDARHV